MKKLLILILLGILVSGCSMTIPSLFPKNTVNKNYEKIYNKGCKSSIDEKTKKIVKICEEEFSLITGSGEKPLGFFATITGTLGRATVLTIIGFGLFFIISPVAFTQFFQRRKLALEKNKYQKALGQVVRGIDKSKAIDIVPQLKSSLSAETDVDTKMIIDDIKRQV